MRPTCALSTTHPHLESRGEFHHLFCLDVPEPVHSGNTVTDGQHTASLLQVSAGVCAQDLLFQDGGHLGSACAMRPNAAIKLS